MAFQLLSPRPKLLSIISTRKIKFPSISTWMLQIIRRLMVAVAAVVAAGRYYYSVVVVVVFFIIDFFFFGGTCPSHHGFGYYAYPCGMNYPHALYGTV